ncbi:TetR family transcriptional regulator [Streptomyces sp. Ru87]|uniref:TetR family transcriptional regulator n=1 Tax=Streptomyces sp. Ru87 TaxID=2044307 RepID=UPI000BF65B00|nr:TetR family transcriptional regulator [Streptomyces sp. Ru87]PGH50612.1 TetR family transcriptional regulator [Streptomyces sp. Ru87]
MSEEAKPGGPPLTARQEERRRRILEAAVRLASDGGFDAVQMREVAERSGVALGTLYRYFPSKIYLLVATLRGELGRLHETLRERPPEDPDPAARVTGTLLRAFGAMRREPRLADAMMRALTFADRSVTNEVDAVSRLTTAIILDAVGLDGPPTAEQLSAVRVVQYTWHATVVGRLSGRVSEDRVRTDLETAGRLIARTVPAGSRADNRAGSAPGAEDGARRRLQRRA